MVSMDFRQRLVTITALSFALESLSAQSSDRARLMAQIAGPEGAAELLRVFDSGTRPWEATPAEPVVVRQRDSSNDLDRTFYFTVEASDLKGSAPHLPRSKRETAFVRALDRIRNSEAPSPWPVFVFSGASDPGNAPDIFSVASTRRIFVRDGNDAPRPAAAILLNSAYWGTADAGAVEEDRLTEIVAAHELHHARRAWRRAEETAAHTDAIEARLHQAGVTVDSRARLEFLVQRGLMAWEEVEAVDSSLAGRPLPTYRRQSYIEYRERNRALQGKTVKLLASLFTSVKDGAAKKELESWITGLLRKDLLPR